MARSRRPNTHEQKASLRKLRKIAHARTRANTDYMDALVQGRAAGISYIRLADAAGVSPQAAAEAVKRDRSTAGRAESR